jgi:hypothetical protein
MSNFGYLFENMDRSRKFDQEYQDSQAMEAISNGMNVDENFWQNFIALLNNTEALSALLGTPSIKMNKWRGRIQKYLRKYLEESGEETDLKKKRKLVDISDYEY